jgi:hypothetical protein
MIAADNCCVGCVLRAFIAAGSCHDADSAWHLIENLELEALWRHAV